MTIPARLRELFQPGLPRPVVVFDLDGVLISDALGYGDVFYQTLSEISGLPRDIVEPLAHNNYIRTGRGLDGLIDQIEGWTLEKATLCHNQASHTFLTTVLPTIAPHTALSSQLETLATRTAALGLLTANRRHHGETVLNGIAIGHHFTPWLVMGSDCANDKHKNCVDGYAPLLQRIHHLPHGTRVVMVEDSAPNLTAARMAGIITVHVGDKDHAPFRDVIDFKFDALDDALAEMNGDRV